MQLDWLTVVAQMINFAILILLLKKFLYTPVTAAMDRRENGIAENLQNAAQREQNATEKAEEYNTKLKDIEVQRNALIKTAQETAEQERLKLLDQARTEVSDQRKQWLAHVDQEQQGFMHHMQEHLEQALQTYTRSALTDLANVELEQEMINTFIHRISNAGDAIREELSKASDEILIISSVEIDQPTRDKIQAALNAITDSPVKNIRFTESADLICGIEMSVNDQTIGWSLDEYLSRIQQSIRTNSSDQHASD